MKTSTFEFIVCLLINVSALPYLSPKEKRAIICNSIRFPWHYRHLHLLHLTTPGSLTTFVFGVVFIKGSWKLPVSQFGFSSDSWSTSYNAKHSSGVAGEPEKNSSASISIQTASSLCGLGIMRKTGFSTETRGPAGNVLLFIYKEINFTTTEEI